MIAFLEKRRNFPKQTVLLALENFAQTFREVEMRQHLEEMETFVGKSLVLQWKYQLFGW